ncbi:GAF domain-containing protein [Caldimonas brevitalea]|uniref:histidine kinase n=1 Tax=Caldimonas brevitalea TaxID=413882 RepID=A0A0G3BLR8_9BURK|nr:GAF domain-containing protein [Caldimonas brevitalea]AKJ30384.1 chemotaxis protein methyltransferase CheR [Caldimonas brevitalea]
MDNEDGFPNGALTFLAGGGDTGALIRSRDWSNTSLGPPAQWPAPLRTLLRLMLQSRQPMFTVWGAERVLVYNDGCRDWLGERHPQAMGQALGTLGDTLAGLTSLVERAYAGDSVPQHDLPVMSIPAGTDPQEASYAFSCIPVRDDHGVVRGIFCAAADTVPASVEHSLRRNETRQAFLLAFGDRLRELGDARDIMAMSLQSLGQHLRASRVGYAQVDDGGDRCTVQCDWAVDGVRRLTGRRRRLSDFGLPLIQRLRAGATVSIADVRTDLLTEGAAVADAYARLDARAACLVPLVKDGRFEAILFVHQQQPRHWREDEAALVREVAERTWAAVERARAEEALRESEARFRAMADHAPVMVWVADAKGCCTYLSQSWYEFTGQTPSLGLGRGWIEALHPDDRHATQSALQHVGLHPHPFRHECRLRRAGASSYCWVLNSAAPHFGERGEFLGYVGSVIDISDRKRTEQALAQSSDRLKLLWASAQVMLNASNPKAMLSQLFEKVAPQLQLDCYFSFMRMPGEAALNLSSYTGITQDEAHVIQRIEFGQGVCGAVALERKPIVASYIQESRDPRTEGARRFGLRAYACMPLGDGERLLGTLSFASRSRDSFTDDDVEFLSTIARYVAIAHERLQFVDDLREADRRKDLFLATLAHELRNPLAPVLQAVHILGMPAAGEAERSWSRRVIERQVHNMSLLLDDLLDVSRITLGKLQLKKEHVALGDVVRSAVETAQPLIDARRHSLTLDLPSEPVWLQADPLRFAQILANLLTNAAKYTDPGGRLVLRAHCEGGELFTSVRDNGIGLERSALRSIFGMFTQATASLDRSQGGLGIGLALVRGLVELHGGGVEAHSEGPGRGSEFIVRLPLGRAGHGGLPAATTSGDAVQAARTRRVLVADDNRDAAETLSAFLQMQGHDVRTAYDGQQALAVAQEFRPEVCLLDIGMPRLNGFQVASRLRETHARPPVMIALTGWGQEADKQRTLQAGFDRHFTKPVDLGTLEKAMRTLLEAPKGQMAGP